MAYTKNPTWQQNPVGGTPVTADKLNHLEDGVATAATTADGAAAAAANAVTTAAGDATTKANAAQAAAIAAASTDATNKVAAETTRATTAEGNLSTSVGNEATRATAAEQANATAISNEITRATGVEATKVNSSTYVAGLAAKADALVRTAVQTGATYTASAGQLVPVDTTNNAVTVTLPNAPADKTQVAVKQILGTAGVTINTAGTDTLNRVGGVTTMSLLLLAQGATYQYDTATKVWTVTAADIPLAQLTATFVARWKPSTAYLAGDVTLAPTGQIIKRKADGTSRAAYDASEAALWTVQSAASIPGIYTPEQFGAAAAFVSGTDDTTFVQQALDAAGAAAGVVLLSRNYSVPAGGLTISKSIKVMGVGSYGASTSPSSGSGYPPAGFAVASGLIATSATATMLTITANGVVLEDFAVVNTNATATAGVGIKTSTGGNGGHMRGLYVSGFYDNLEWAAGYYWSLTESHILDPVRHGIYMHNTVPNGDYGDPVVANSWVGMQNRNVSATGDAVRWESGGGLRWIGNKINGYLGNYAFANGLNLLVADGVSTSVAVITGSSFENITGAAVKVGTKGPNFTGLMSKVVVSGNEFYASSSGVVVDSNNAAARAEAVVVGDNVFTDIANPIQINVSKCVTVGINTHIRCTTPVSIGVSCNDVQVAEQNVTGDGINLVLDQSYSNGGGVCRQTFNRDVPSTTSTSVYSTLWTVTPALYSGGVLDFSISGTVSNAGGFVIQGKRTWVNTDGASAVALTTAGTDTAVGTAVDYLLDVATNGKIILKIKRNTAAAGTAVVGRANLALHGPALTVRRGA